MNDTPYDIRKTAQLCAAMVLAGNGFKSPELAEKAHADAVEFIAAAILAERKQCLRLGATAIAIAPSLAAVTHPR